MMRVLITHRNLKPPQTSKTQASKLEKTKRPKKKDKKKDVRIK